MRAPRPRQPWKSAQNLSRLSATARSNASALSVNRMPRLTARASFAAAATAAALSMNCFGCVCWCECECECVGVCWCMLVMAER